MTNLFIFKAEAEKILRFFLREPAQRAHGAQISEATQLTPHNLYPHLISLERLNVLASEFEQRVERVMNDPAGPPPPRKRLYWLTDEGRELARAAIEKLDRA